MLASGVTLFRTDAIDPSIRCCCRPVGRWVIRTRTARGVGSPSAGVPAAAPPGRRSCSRRRPPPPRHCHWPRRRRRCPPPPPQSGRCSSWCPPTARIKSNAKEGVRQGGELNVTERNPNGRQFLVGIATHFSFFFFFQEQVKKARNRRCVKKGAIFWCSCGGIISGNSMDE